jgi:TonB family protein
MTFRALFTILSLGLLAVATSGFPRKMGQPPATIITAERNSAMLIARFKQAPVTIATNPPTTDIPSYPDTPQGLEKQMKDMMKLEKQGKSQELAPYAKSLLLPDADNWFKSVFGDSAGTALAFASELARNGIEFGAPETLATLRKNELTDVRAVRFDDSCSPLATPTEYPVLVLRQRPEPLYDVRFSDGSKESVWAYFAYVDGAFRFIGSLKKANAGYLFQRTQTQPSVSKSEGTEAETKERIRVAGYVQRATLIHQETPIYPRDAKDNHIQGTVLLHAVIAKDGSIRDLDVNEGVCSLARSAMEAVKKWRYRPTLLNGDPVEVDTTISVVFTLGNH